MTFTLALIPIQVGGTTKEEVLTTIHVGTEGQLDVSSEAEALSHVASGIATSLGVSEQQHQHQGITIAEFRATRDGDGNTAVAQTIVSDLHDASDQSSAVNPLADIAAVPQQVEDEQVLVNYSVAGVLVANGQAMEVLQSSADGSTVVLAPSDEAATAASSYIAANVEDAMEKLHEGAEDPKETPSSSSPPSKVKRSGSGRGSEGDKKPVGKGISQIAQDWDEDD